MATHDYNIANDSGANVRSDINDALSAIVSHNSNATAPTTTFAYMHWMDTSLTVDTVKIRNAADSAWATLYTDTGLWRGADGSAASPSVSFGSDADLGLYRSAANELSVSCNGTQCGAITVNHGAFNELRFLGFLTTGFSLTPGPVLNGSVSGTTTLQLTSSRVFVSNVSTSAATPGFSNGGDADTGIFWPAANSLGFSTGGTERLRIDSNGVFNPTANFQLFRSTGGTSNGNIAFVYSDTAPQLLFRHGGTSKLSIFPNSGDSTVRFLFGSGIAFQWRNSSNSTVLSFTESTNAFAVGTASTETWTFTSRCLHRSVTDAGPMTATAGTQREIVFNTSDSKFYGCTATGSPATWAALH